MSKHLTRLQSRIREAGMNKVASAIAAMPPRQRLLTRVCLTKNAGLLGDLLNWSSENPELAGAIALGGPAAVAAAAASKKNKLRNALLLGGGASILGAAGGSAYRNRDKIKEALGIPLPPTEPPKQDKATQPKSDATDAGKEDSRDQRRAKAYSEALNENLKVTGYDDWIQDNADAMNGKAYVPPEGLVGIDPIQKRLLEERKAERAMMGK